MISWNVGFLVDALLVVMGRTRGEAETVDFTREINRTTLLPRTDEMLADPFWRSTCL